MTPVRISDKNYKQLEREAKAESRSITAQLNFILKIRYLERDWVERIGNPEVVYPMQVSGPNADPNEEMLGLCKHNAFVGLCKKGCK